MKHIAQLCAIASRCLALLLWAVLFTLPVCAQTTYTLDEQIGSFRLQDSLAYLVIPTDKSSLENILQRDPEHFAPSDTAHGLPLETGKTIWVRLRLKQDTHTHAHWTLSIPLPYLDFAALYQPNGQGGWTRQVAGDTLAVDSWSRPALYPDFSLNIPPNQDYDIYLELRNYKPTLIPLVLSTESKRDGQREFEHFLLGGLFGAMLMLVGVCLLNYLQHQNLDNGLYALYATGMVIVVSSMTGLSGLWIWPQSPTWSDWTHLSMPVLGFSTSLFFVRHIASLDVELPRLSLFTYWLAGLGIPVALLGAAIDPLIADGINAVYLAICPLLILVATGRTWYRGHAIGSWLTMAFAPSGIVTIYIALQKLHALPAWWQSRYLMVAAVAISVPILHQALQTRARERRDARERANALPSQDALTGLLSGPLFDAQVELAIKRSQLHKEPSAIVMVEVVNHSYLRETYGDSIAEQCLLRAAVKLHRVLRDVDPAGRIDTARFGLVLHGMSSRQALTKRMVRLVASGLIPLPGLQPEVTLQFHMSCALLTEVAADKGVILQELQEILRGISPRTRRPIRFLEPPAPPIPRAQ